MDNIKASFDYEESDEYWQEERRLTEFTSNYTIKLMKVKVELLMVLSRPLLMEDNLILTFSDQSSFLQNFMPQVTVAMQQHQTAQMLLVGQSRN